MNFFEKIMDDRKDRLADPGFMAEMAAEKTEFKGILKNLGTNTLDAGYTALLKVPTKILSRALKTFYDKKYGKEAYLKDSFKLFFGKNGVMYTTSKVIANIIHLTGKSAKIGLRQLFAK